MSGSSTINKIKLCMAKNEGKEYALITKVYACVVAVLS